MNSSVNWTDVKFLTKKTERQTEDRKVIARIDRKVKGSDRVVTFKAIFRVKVLMEFSKNGNTKTCAKSRCRLSDVVSRTGHKCREL